MSDTPMDKIETLFKLLAERYGAYDLKPGQNLELIKKTWCYSVGRYAKPDIKAAAMEYFAAAKYTRWPEEGQLIEILKSHHCRPESSIEIVDNRPEHEKRAAVESDKFYRGLFLLKPPSPYAGFSYVVALNEMLAGLVAENKTKSFGELLTQAWYSGDLDGFEAKAHAIFDKWRQQRDRVVLRRGDEDRAAKARRARFCEAAQQFGYLPPSD